MSKTLSLDCPPSPVSPSSQQPLKSFLQMDAEHPADEPEYKENENLNKFSVLLRPRSDLLCYKFIENIRKRLDAKKYGKKQKYLTEMMKISKPKIKREGPVIDTLEAYIASLNLDENDLDQNGMNGSNTLDFAFGENWKQVVRMIFI